MLDGMSDDALNKAYSIRTMADCLRVYRDWAASYDTAFAAGMDYQLPAHVARLFCAAGGRGPVLDVGAGTGLLAKALTDGGFADPIDGIDLSPEMLAKAADKGLYRSLFAADVTQPLAIPAKYRGIVSSGTFTHGHVGPEAIANLLDVARPDALIALSINAAVYRDAGFERVMQRLSPRHRDLQLIDVAIYGADAGAQNGGHAADRAIIALFRTPDHHAPR
jgi:SAM-dependent methyltransferase